MIVKLSKECLGKTILEAFKHGVASQNLPEMKWEVEESILGNTYVMENNHLVVVNKTVEAIATASILRVKKFFWYEYKEWDQPTYTPFELTLQQLALDQLHKEIVIDVRYWMEYQSFFGTAWLLKDEPVQSPEYPYSEAVKTFEKIRPQFETMIKTMILQLNNTVEVISPAL